MTAFSRAVHFISDTHSNAICPDHIQGDDLTPLSFARGDSIPLRSRAGCLATLTVKCLSDYSFPSFIQLLASLSPSLLLWGTHYPDTGSLLQSGPIPSPPTAETIRGKTTHFIPQLQGPVALPSLQ